MMIILLVTGHYEDGLDLQRIIHSYLYIFMDMNISMNDLLQWI